MDEESIRIIASAAAGVIVRAMGTAAWRAVRDRWSRLLGRGDSGQEDLLAGQLEESAQMLATTEPDRREQLASELEAEWRGALRVQLRTDPELIAAVRALVDTSPHSPEPAAVSVQQVATVSGGTSIQSGRDTHVGRP